MAGVKSLMTAEEFALLDEERPCELVRGEIVAMNRPTRRHGKVCMNVAFALEEWARRSEAGEVVINDAGVITTRDPDSVRGPDCYFIRAERVPQDDDGWLEVAPDLAIEVLSAGDRRGDVAAKVAEYLAAGVEIVWVLDPRRRNVQVHRAVGSPEVLGMGETIASPTVLPGFSCAVAEFFRGV